MHIIGAGGHAKVIVDNVIAAKGNIFGVWSDDTHTLTFLNYQIKGNIEYFQRLKETQFIIAIGNNIARKNIAKQLGNSSVHAIHPTSSISPIVDLGFGTVVMSNASINANAKIGKHVIINTNASVDHDCLIDDFVHVSPQAGLAGNVSVGEGTHIGIGAVIIQGIKIGKWTTIGAGAVIIKDIPDYAVVVGNPGRIIKYNKNEY